MIDQNYIKQWAEEMNIDYFQAILLLNETDFDFKEAEVLLYK